MCEIIKRVDLPSIYLSGKISDELWYKIEEDYIRMGKPKAYPNMEELKSNILQNIIKVIDEIKPKVRTSKISFLIEESINYKSTSSTIQSEYYYHDEGRFLELVNIFSFERLKYVLANLEDINEMAFIENMAFTVNDTKQEDESVETTIVWKLCFA